MKTKTLCRWGKTLAFAFLGFGLLTFTSCDMNVGTMNGLMSEVKKDVQVDGNSLTYGDHVYTVNGELNYGSTDYKNPTAYVTFTNIPSGYAEFEAVYNNLLGKTPQGVAAMVPMAIEIYARDQATGERCLNLLCNSSATVNNITRILKTKLTASKYSPENDSYLQRYMAAALLKGANNQNAYTPSEPYTVEMCTSPNGIQDAPLTGGKVYYLFILADGWDTYQRSIEVFQPYNTDTYKVFNCPAAYAQCKNIIGTWPGLK